MRILHVLDHSLPLHSGYTFRTRAILHAQQAMGLEVRGVTGQRQLDSAAWSTSAATLADPEVAEGLTFHRTPGVPKGLPGLREWGEITALARRIEALAEG